ncbi:Protein of unknown function [Cotesia congregata]|uniref:Uncharacterized protein n=1 Tax=Cotesia congregata TaxID=51543 RepID=A0A8J2HBT8_COTCN|nr:Protein of unknown function [Cotesia congregata]
MEIHMARVHGSYGKSTKETILDNWVVRKTDKRKVHGETYFRLNDLFGMYYVNRKQLNTLVPYDPAEINTLSYIECLDRYSSNDVFINFYCPRYECYGRLHKCREAGSFNFCEARTGANRRYAFTLDGKQFPTRPYDCNGRFVDTLAKETDNLLCQCSEEGAESLATKAINLMPQMSDIENNMVVTNVRFLKKNNMVHMQIEEGLLLPDGNIDKSTVSSVPVGNFRYLQNSTQGSFVQLDPTEWDDRLIQLNYDRDYTFLYHNRSTINLDDIIVDVGYVVTGVKFDTEENNPGTGINYSPIQLKVHGTPFNYDTGLLEPTDKKPSRWFTPFDMKGKIKRYSYMREMLDITNSDDSIKNTGAVQQYPTNFQVTFQVTSWEKDMGQTVVPYFDTLSAAVSNKVALDGVGISYRGSQGFGGFIAPKIFNVDHAQTT